MAKLNKIQKYAILWLNSTGLNVESIAAELNVTKAQVSRLIPKPEKNTTQSSNVASNTQLLSPKDLMITHTAGKKVNSVAIMTKEASEIADAMSKKSRSYTNDQKGIFRPK